MDIKSLTPDAKQRLLDSKKDPKSFAENYLLSPNPSPGSKDGRFVANYIQSIILTSTALVTWICVTRRAGKSFSLCIIALFHALTRENCKIVVFFKSTTQRDELFQTLDEWIRVNPLIKEMLSKDGNTKDPQKRSFLTGSYIAGYILGVGEGNQGKLRGITGDVVLLDECHLFSTADWKVILPIVTGDLTRRGKIKTYAAGTLDDANGYYYEKICKKEAEPYELVLRIPITENIDWTDEMVAEEKRKVPPEVWQTEYMLEPGSKNVNVFNRADIEDVFSEDWALDMTAYTPGLPLFMAVDWDKRQGVGVQITVCEYHPAYKTLKAVYQEEIPAGDWTYTNATNRIIELNNQLQPLQIVVDAGAAEMQWEQLQLEGVKNPLSMLTERLIRLPYRKTLEITNPITQELEKKNAKRFLVELLQEKLQEGKVKIPSSREDIKSQFLDYKYQEGKHEQIKFTDENEHILDTFILMMYSCWFLFEDTFSAIEFDFTNAELQVENSELHSMIINDRRIYQDEEPSYYDQEPYFYQPMSGSSDPFNRGTF